MNKYEEALEELEDYIEEDIGSKPMSNYSCALKHNTSPELALDLEIMPILQEAIEKANKYDELEKENLALCQLLKEEKETQRDVQTAKKLLELIETRKENEKLKKALKIYQRCTIFNKYASFGGEAISIEQNDWIDNFVPLNEITKEEYEFLQELLKELDDEQTD